MNSGWIEWNGGECPVKPNENVFIILRLDREEFPGLSYDEIVAKSEYKGLGFDNAVRMRWNHTKNSTFAGSGDIVAYKIIK